MSLSKQAMLDIRLRKAGFIFKGATTGRFTVDSKPRVSAKKEEIIC